MTVRIRMLLSRVLGLKATLKPTEPAPLPFPEKSREQQRRLDLYARLLAEAKGDYPSIHPMDVAAALARWNFHEAAARTYLHAARNQREGRFHHPKTGEEIPFGDWVVLTK